MISVMTMITYTTLQTKSYQSQKSQYKHPVLDFNLILLTMITMIHVMTMIS